MNQDLSTFFSFQSLLVFLLVMARVSGMISTAPLLSTFPIPMMAKAGLAALSAFIMYPFVLKISLFQMPNDLITMSIMIFKELFVGILIGFCAELIFIGIQIGGQLLSIQMGLAIANALDPVTKQQVPVVGQFYLFMASMVFIYLNGHHWLFSCVSESYNTIPIGINFEFVTNIVPKILYFTSQLFAIAFNLTIPIFGMLFIIDIALALVSKIMPQMNIFMVGLPLKIYVGLALMGFFMSTTAVYLTGLMGNMLNSLKNIFI
ncbi:MAG: flagellar biosynthetic protein FliR [bacterium]